MKHFTELKPRSCDLRVTQAAAAAGMAARHRLPRAWAAWRALVDSERRLSSSWCRALLFHERWRQHHVFFAWRAAAHATLHQVPCSTLSAPSTEATGTVITGLRRAARVTAATELVLCKLRLLQAAAQRGARLHASVQALC